MKIPCLAGRFLALSSCGFLFSSVACGGQSPATDILYDQAADDGGTTADARWPGETSSDVTYAAPRDGSLDAIIDGIQSPVQEVAPSLFRGMNLGNALEAPNEGDWGVWLQPEYFALVKNAGFDFVRIPMRWSNHASNSPPYSIESGFMSRAEWAVDQALGQGLSVVMNIHHFDDLTSDPGGQRGRFLGLWTTISERFKDKSPKLMFELLNEAKDQLGGIRLNQLLIEAIGVIRKANPNRMVIAGGGTWNSIDGLNELALPANDPNIMATFHYYEPFQFTHQGADWVNGSSAWMGKKWTGTESEQSAIRNALDRAASWGKANNRKVLMGEFGAFSKADMDSRTRWTAFVARESEKRGMAWSYWEFCSGFGAWDPDANAWRKPLLQSLVPSK